MLVSIVFESMFGNTAALARAVAEGMRTEGAEVVLSAVGDDSDHVLLGRDLLVLAAPTHAFSSSRPATRADAVSRGASPVAARTGVREWIETLPEIRPVGARPLVAVFDTRAQAARRWPGSAARRMARSMRAEGYTVVDRTSFYVSDVEGPVLDGELAAAAAWGRTVAQTVRHSSTLRDAGA